MEKKTLCPVTVLVDSQVSDRCPWATCFVSPTQTHTSNDFQSDINWPLLAAAGVSSRDHFVKGDLTLVSLGNYLNPHLLTEVNSVLSHQYCHDRDSTDRDSTEFHTDI